MNHIVIIITLAMLILCYSLISHAILILYYHGFMSTLHTSLISCALWLPMCDIRKVRVCISLIKRQGHQVCGLIAGTSKFSTLNTILYVKVCGCYLVCVSRSPTSANQIYTIEVVLHQQIYNEAYSKTGLKIGPPLIQVWLQEVHVC